MTPRPPPPSSCLRAEWLRDGQIRWLRLARPPANVLDAEMVAALRAEVDALPAGGPLKLVVLDHEGPHFSYGASVEEHLPERVAGMLGAFHDLFRALERAGVPTAAVVRGQCLGGGLELAIAAGRLFVDRSARLGLPEVKLAVFPPVGSLLLPSRVHLAAAIELVLSGAVVGAEEASRIGLADDCSDDPGAACLAWFDGRLAPRSAVAVRQAWRALRRPIARLLDEELPRIERQYLEELMDHRDPVEGLHAFLERRDPRWVHA